ncbi:hypothetical protein EDD76_102142 [Kineothrix alysoides]|uniref:Uncharacterized protein n=1 Tax=Kineothrix alysoides TaxID=1469948 RepID=A0A4R1R4L4_9FIRM|nr:hypothetical protein EDD76_102142 [Kineothrix alysoides]
MNSFPIFKIRWVIRTKVCFVHPCAQNFDSTAFVPRAQLRIVCPKGFYVIGAPSYYIKTDTASRSALLYLF